MLADAPGPSAPPDGVGVVLVAGPTPGRWHDMAEGFRSLDSEGCSAIWLADHLFWGEPMPEALTTTAVAAASTRRCWVGTGVLQLPMRSTSAVAKAAATLDLVSQGRFALGVGVGEHRREFELAGAEYRRRGEALDRGIAELRSLWSPADPDPRYRQLPQPGAVPVWIGGRSGAARRRAARLGDGWFPMFVTPEQLRQGNHDLTQEVAEAGREPGSVLRAVTVLAAVDGSAGGRGRALDWCGRLWGLDPDRIGSYLVSGSPTAVAEAIGAYRAAGAQHVSVLLATDAPVAQMTDLLRHLGG